MKYSTKPDLRQGFQFYPADWLADTALSICSLAARGLWMHCLCMMFFSDPRGTLRTNGKQITSKQLAKAAGEEEANVKKLLSELEECGVFSRLEDGTIICRRMFHAEKRQEEIARVRAEAGSKGGRAKTGSKPPANVKQEEEATDKQTGSKGPSKPEAKPKQNDPSLTPTLSLTPTTTTNAKEPPSPLKRGKATLANDFKKRQE